MVSVIVARFMSIVLDMLVLVLTFLYYMLYL
jgi:hypothetical protein